MKSKSLKKVSLSDANLLLTITIVVFFLMYIGAMIFEGGGFLKPQTFFNILNANGALIITACGLSLVMITGSIDISVGGVVALVSMLSGLSGFQGRKFVCISPDCTCHWSWIWSGTGIFGSVSGYPAIYRNTCRYVFCKRYDFYRTYRSVQCTK